LTRQVVATSLGSARCSQRPPVFWIDRFHPHGVKQHTAFVAKSRAGVDAFLDSALKAGGAENGAPGLHRPNYYAAYVLDPDGNNIEAVCRES
jgi:catechol 2,3-dioxygenase-like lactoylglutathione lyase family enzyme